MEGLGLALFPRVNKDLLSVWDNKKQACCGFLMKKASNKSVFSRGNWQQRWFKINTELVGHDNYALMYYHGQDDNVPSATYPLDGAMLNVGENNQFSISFKGDSKGNGLLELDCESFEVSQMWIETLSHVIDV